MKSKNLKLLKNYCFFKLFLKFFLKKGKLKTAERNFKLLFFNLLKNTKLGKYTILSKIRKNLYINFETRKIRRRKIVYIVPVPVNKKRQYFIILRWLFESANKDKRRVSIVTKLYDEIIRQLKNVDSDSRLKKMF